IAVNDGKIVALGHHAISLQDATGNVYSYSQLGSVQHVYAVPKPEHITRARIGVKPENTPPPAPTSPASAGTQTAGARPAKARAAAVKTATPAHVLARTVASTESALANRNATAQPLVKQRLFANPRRPAAYAAGGA